MQRAQKQKFTAVSLFAFEQVKAADLFKGGSLRRHVMQSSVVEQLVVHPENNIAFILTEHQTIIVYRSNVRRLEPIECPGNLWERKHHRIRQSIQRRRITDIFDLLAACGKEIEVKYARLEWYL